MHYKTPTARNEITLFNQLEDWVDINNPVRVIDLFVDKFVENSSTSYSKGEEAKGRKAYSISCMLKLYLYGYFNQIKSSRKLEAETYRNMEVIFLIGNLHPDHRTISGFRKDNSEIINQIFSAFRNFLQKEGLINLKTVAYDGTKLKAYASSNGLSLQQIASRLARLDKRLSDYLNLLNTEDNIEELQNDIESLDDEKASLLKIISELKEEIDNLQNAKDKIKEVGDKSYIYNDSDSRIVKTRDGYRAGFNAQVGVDQENHIIINTIVTNDTNDISQLESLIEDTIQETNVAPETVLADCGYCNFDQIIEVEKKGCNCIIPIPRSAKKIKDEINGISFIYRQENDSYLCPNDKSLEFSRIAVKRGASYKVYKAIQSECDDCEKRNFCTTSKYGRSIWIDERTEFITNYKKKIQKPESKHLIKRRKGIIENVFGTIKVWMGKHPLLLKGLKGAQTEMSLYATCYNLRRYINIIGVANAMSRLQEFAL